MRVGPGENEQEFAQSQGGAGILSGRKIYVKFKGGKTT